MFELEERTPEQCGISGGAIQEFEERLAQRRVRMHGYLMLSGRSILAERYWEPYGVGTNHRMYSVTKSFTAMAVGLLLKQGRISLSDKICAYFPEKLPKTGAHPWCAEMTIEDMLSMRTCHASTTYGRYGGGDWTESFFQVAPDHVPGTVFSYDTSSSHVLAALVEKLSGMDMLDFLRGEVLDRLGFSKGAYILKDPFGVSQGGSGLMCTLRDVARAAFLCNHYGVLEGEQLLPRDFMERATGCQVPTDLQPTMDEQCGYGYQFWMPRKEGFGMYGLGGQLAVCFPRLDFCFVTMADTIGNPAGLQLIYDGFFDTIYPHLEQREQKTAETAAASIAPENQASHPSESRTSGTYVFYENQPQWKRVRFVWEEQKLELETPEGIAGFFFQEDKYRRQKFPGTAYECECKGCWKAGHFLLHCYVTDEEQGHVSMDFAWKDQRLSVRMVSTGEPFLKHYRGFASAYRNNAPAENRDA